MNVEETFEQGWEIMESLMLDKGYYYQGKIKEECIESVLGELEDE